MRTNTPMHIESLTVGVEYNINMVLDMVYITLKFYLLNQN